MQQFKSCKKWPFSIQFKNSQRVPYAIAQHSCWRHFCCGHHHIGCGDHVHVTHVAAQRMIAQMRAIWKTVNHGDFVFFFWVSLLKRDTDDAVSKHIWRFRKFILKASQSVLGWGSSLVQPQGRRYIFGSDVLQPSRRAFCTSSLRFIEATQVHPAMVTLTVLQASPTGGRLVFKQVLLNSMLKF